MSGTSNAVAMLGEDITSSADNDTRIVLGLKHKGPSETLETDSTTKESSTISKGVGFEMSVTTSQTVRQQRS